MAQVAVPSLVITKINIYYKCSYILVPSINLTDTDFSVKILDFKGVYYLKPDKPLKQNYNSGWMVKISFDL